MIRSALVLLLLYSSSSVTVTAQFKCTLQASGDEDTCLKTVGDDDQHCAWCSLGGFAFCLSEQAAEAMEQTLNAECDRFNGSDDDSKPKTDDDIVPSADDIFPANDDDDSNNKSDDDNIKPTDDALPDNFWTCLQEKSQDSCDGKGCTWCTAQSAGFSLCMTGPAAEQAESSKFFECDNGPAMDADGVASARDPYDASCVEAFLEDQTEDACTSAMDQDGESCQWCSLAGMTNLCLTPDQADMGQSLGITCETSDKMMDAGVMVERKQLPEKLAAPLYDTSCMMSFLQDHSSAGCASAVDSEGSPCEYCPVLNGAVDLCLTSDQVSLLEQSGVPCQQDFDVTEKNPYDTTCIAASFSGAGKDGCVGTLDDEGSACRYCSVGGMASLCLTGSQADLVGSYGVACDEEEVADIKLQDNPYDTACLMAFLQDQSEESCVAAMDEDGDACKYCTLQGAVSLCLTPSQADMAGGLGIECNDNGDAPVVALRADEIFDMSCVKVYLSDQSEDSCRGARDEDGAACKWCHTPQSGDICLTASQGDIAGQIGMWCDDDDKEELTKIGNVDAIAQANVGLPGDFWECLQNLGESECSPSCTWCDTSVGMGFCMSTPVAESTRECTFFDCNFKDEEKIEEDEKTVDVKSSDPFDPTCLGAGMGSDDAEQVCSSTVDGSGNDCVWCNAAGEFGVCVSAEQASTMGNYLDCNAASPLIAVA